MRRGSWYLVSLLGVLFLASGCASFTEYGKLHESAQANYARGNYDASVSEVVHSLRINPNYDASKKLVGLVFPKAVDFHTEDIKAAKNGNAKFKWDKVVSEYEILIRLNREVKSLPNLMDNKEPIRFDLRDYSSELAEAKNSAAEDHYQEGRRLFGKEGIGNRDEVARQFRAANSYVPEYKDGNTMAAEGYYQEGLLLCKGEDVDTQKRAAKAFKAVLEFVPGYKDATLLYERSRKAGIKRIAVIPFEDKSGRGTQYGAVAETIVDGLVSDIMNDRDATEFLEIVSRDQLERVVSEQKLSMSGIVDANTATQVGKILGVHEILTGQITQVAVTPERTIDKRLQETRNVVIGTQQYSDNGKIKERSVWGDVYATVAIYTRTAGASISGSYKVIDVKTAKLKDTLQFKGAYAFGSEWGTFTGDQRALSDTSKKMLSKAEETAPVADEMVNRATRDLVSSLSSTLKRYAR